MAKKSFKIRGNLAEALDETVSSAINNAGELHIEIIPLEKIQLDEENPRALSLTLNDIRTSISGRPEQKKRKQIEKSTLESLAKSIEEQGVINPVVVYKEGNNYHLIAGERRTLASILAGKQDIPARILTLKPAPLKLSLLQWIENMEREDLTLWERMRNLEKIVNSYAKEHSRDSSEVTATDISKLLGVTIQQGVNYRNVLQADNILKGYIESGEIKSIEKAAYIAKSPQKLQTTLIHACISGTTLAEMKKLVNRANPNTIKKLPPNTTQSNFGSIPSTKVAKLIVDSILQNTELNAIHPSIQNIPWDDEKAISRALKKLLKSLELV